MPDLPPIDDDGTGKFKPQNRKKIDAADLKKLAPQQRSRYMANTKEETADADKKYEDPPKKASEGMAYSKKMITERKRQDMRNNASTPEDDVLERDKHAKLIGQLKAAEARNRLRIMRLRYQANRAQEISHLISCQPTALKAVRLQALVPAYPDKGDRRDRLMPLDNSYIEVKRRERVEALLEDAKGLLTNRIH